MNGQYFREIPHVSKQPVSVERIHPDRILIEGVLFDGDYFREIGHPDADVLYMVRKDVDGCVCLTVIRDELEAKKFFEKTLEEEYAV